MIDNLPFYTEDALSIKNSYENESLEYLCDEIRVNRRTGELYYTHKRKYSNLTLIFESADNLSMKKLTVRGSIHKFFNGGTHNANNFSFADLKKTLLRVSRELGIELSKCVLKPFEYGLNLNLNDFSNFDAEKIVHNLMCEQRKMFQQNVSGIDSSVVSGSYENETRIKAYVKSLEFPDHCQNTLRIENQQKKLRDLHKRNIKYVSDLLELKNQKIIVEKYLQYIKHIVLFDYTIQLPKNSKYKFRVLRLKNPNHWRTIIKNCSKRKFHKTKYNEETKLLNSLSKKYGQNILNKLIQQAEKQCRLNLGYCSVNAFYIQKTPNYAQVQKPNYAQLYNTCIPCETSRPISFLSTKG